MESKNTHELVRQITLMVGRVSVAAIAGFLAVKSGRIAVEFSHTADRAVQAFREDTE